MLLIGEATLSRRALQESVLSRACIHLHRLSGWVLTQGYEGIVLLTFPLGTFKRDEGCVWRGKKVHICRQMVPPDFFE